MLKPSYWHHTVGQLLPVIIYAVFSFNPSLTMIDYVNVSSLFNKVSLKQLEGLLPSTYLDLIFVAAASFCCLPLYSTLLFSWEQTHTDAISFHYQQTEQIPNTTTGISRAATLLTNQKPEWLSCALTQLLQDMGHRHNAWALINPFLSADQGQL